MMEFHISDGLRCLQSLNTCSATTSEVAEASQQDHVHKKQRKYSKPNLRLSCIWYEKQNLIPKIHYNPAVRGLFQEVFQALVQTRGQEKLEYNISSCGNNNAIWQTLLTGDTGRFKADMSPGTVCT